MPQLRLLFLSPSQDQVIDYLDRELLCGQAQLLERSREFTLGCPAPAVRLLKGRRQWSTPLFTDWLPAPVSNKTFSGCFPFCLKMFLCKTLSHNLFFSPLQMNNCLGRSFVLTAALPGTQVLRDFWFSAHRVRAKRAQASSAWLRRRFSWEKTFHQQRPWASVSGYPPCVHRDSSMQLQHRKSRHHTSLFLTITQRKLTPSRITGLWLPMRDFWDDHRPFPRD